jgi:uncharacterized membrane protein
MIISLPVRKKTKNEKNSFLLWSSLYLIFFFSFFFFVLLARGMGWSREDFAVMFHVLSRFAGEEPKPLTHAQEKS